MTNRRTFIKTIATTGLIFSGISGFSCQEREEKDTIKAKHFDIVVVGGGPGGIPAALSAARLGASVLLIEQYGFLGGMATSALVNPFMPYNAGEKIIIRGSFEELLNQLEKEHALHPNKAAFDDEKLKWITENMLLDAGVKILYHTKAIGVYKKDNSIKLIKIFHKGGIENISADIFIDSTGDGDIAAWAGAEIKIGRNSDHFCQPMTTCFRMANVEIDRIPPHAEINKKYEEAKKKGEIENPRENVLFFKTPQPDVIHFNTTRIIGKTSLDGWSISEAEIEGRKQVKQMVNFLKKYIPGFENAYLIKMGTQIGVRESRRVMGYYILTADDVLKAKKFEDGIACSSYPIDIHNPSGTGTVLENVPKGDYYMIPYRSIVPKKIHNLLIASRCISATHEAHASLRIMPVVWAIGQAAGTAAYLIQQQNLGKCIELPFSSLKKALLEQNVFLSS